MLRTVLYVVGGFAGLVGAFIVWRLYATIAGGNRAYKARLEAIAPVAEAISSGRTPSEGDLERFARDRKTRQVLHDVLAEADKLHLFPKEYLTQPALAEADLVGWLCHPNELQVAPDEIELIGTHPAPGASDTQYFLFRYRTHEPHWAAKDGWMAGWPASRARTIWLNSQRQARPAPSAASRRSRHERQRNTCVLITSSSSSVGTCRHQENSDRFCRKAESRVTSAARIHQLAAQLVA
jgi:hypothetical protein